MDRTASLLTAVLVFALINPAFLPSAPLRPPRDSGIDTSWRRRIDEEKPKRILLGARELMPLVQPRAGDLALSAPRAASAWQYIVMKNVVARAAYKPETVVLLFCGVELTEPALRADGRYRALIDPYAGADEPTLDRLAYLRLSRLEYWLRRSWPLYQKRIGVKENMESWVRHRGARRLGSTDAYETETAFEDTFAPRHWRREVLRQCQDALREAAEFRRAARYDFARQYAESFLPAIIDIARREGIRLVLASAPASDPNQQALADYLDQLRAYARKNDLKWRELPASETR